MILSSELLKKLKTVKLPGTLKLKSRCVLPGTTLFPQRKREFLDELRLVRESMAVKMGPNKSRRKDSESEAKDCDSNGLLLAGHKPTVEKKKKNSKSGKSIVIPEGKLSKFSAEEQKLIKEMFQ